MNRHERIRTALTHLASLGVVNPDYYSHGGMPGKRWVFTPTGFSERALTTSGIEDFILGATAALNARGV